MNTNPILGCLHLDSFRMKPGLHNQRINAVNIITTSVVGIRRYNVDDDDDEFDDDDDDDDDEDDDNSIIITIVAVITIIITRNMMRCRFFATFRR